MTIKLMFVVILVMSFLVGCASTAEKNAKCESQKIDDVACKEEATQNRRPLSDHFGRGRMGN